MIQINLKMDWNEIDRVRDLIKIECESPPSTVGSMDVMEDELKQEKISRIKSEYFWEDRIGNQP